MRKSHPSQNAPAWLALLAVGALTSTGCSSNEASAQSAPQKQQQAAQSIEPPVIEKLQVSMLAKERPEGNARLMARVSRNSTDTIRQGFFTLRPDPKDPARDVLFTDDGRGADDKAGDLIFTGFVRFDFNELRKQNDRIRKLGGPGRVKVLPFVGRRPGRPVSPPIIGEAELVPENPIDVDPLGLAAAIAVDHSLIINSPKVVQDPDRTFSPCLGGTKMGPWTFGHLFTEMVNPALTGNNPSDVARKWLESWHNNQELHFNSAIPRPNVQTIIDQWQAMSGGGQLELAYAPFRLVAIVNRMDLHDAIGYSEGSSGETRFVFALEDGSCNTQPFLVIFEYGNLPEKCDQMQDLAKHWVELGSHPIGSVDYLNILQGITDPIVAANAAPHKLNGSALNQLRTNENHLDGLWQLREFRLDKGSGGFLMPDTVKRTPDISLDGTSDLSTTIDDNLPLVWPNPPISPPDILTGSFDPLEYPAGSGIWIRAMASDVPSNTFCFTASLAGNPAISADDARFEYSSNTCSGCHGGDINASGKFTHIDQNGGLSDFLSGPLTVTDCMTSTLRNFDEPTRRAQILDALANNACERLAMLAKLRAEH